MRRHFYTDELDNEPELNDGEIFPMCLYTQQVDGYYVRDIDETSIKLWEWINNSENQEIDNYGNKCIKSKLVNNKLYIDDVRVTEIILLEGFWEWYPWAEYPGYEEYYRILENGRLEISID